jgi:hypothetical protein
MLFYVHMVIYLPTQYAYRIYVVAY